MATYRRWVETITDDSGIVIPAVSVTVYEAGTTDTIELYANHSGLAFTGSGLNDLIRGRVFTGSVDTAYRIEIDSTGTTDTFKWSNDGGVTWQATGIPITGAAQTLEYGLTVTFAATTGHTLGDRWDFTARPNPFTTGADGVADFFVDAQKWHDVTIVLSKTGYDFTDINDALTFYPIAGAEGIIWRGAWALSTAYSVDDAVEHNGSSYICIAAHTSTASDEPGVGASWTTYWNLLVGGSTFVNLTDTPTTYTGSAGLAPKVNATEDALEFGQLDHGAALTGLGDDDHPQYLLADGTRALAGNWSLAGYDVADLGKLNFDDATILTIATGAVTITQAYHSIDTEAAAATDDLDTINGGVAGDIIYLRAADGTHTVVLKHGTGNIVTPNGSDYSLDDANKAVALIFDGTNWHLVGSAGGVATFTALTDTPSSYTGSAGLAAKVNATEDALEFGQLDHGTALTGLADDDHPQYLLADGTRALTGNWSAGGYDISNLGTLAVNEGKDIKVKMAVPTGITATLGATGTLSGTYYYKVTALDGVGETLPSAEVSGTVDGGTTNGTITVAWTAVPGAAKYRVWRGTTAGGENEYYETTGTSLADDGSLTFTAGTVPTTTTAYLHKVDSTSFYANPSQSYFAGKVGIGIAEPTGWVHLKYTVDHKGYVTEWDGGKAANLFAGTDGGVFQYDEAGYFAIQSAPHNTVIGADIGGAVTRFFIDSNGNIGIGMGSPANILTVVQGSATDPIADSWTTYSVRATKDIVREVNPHGYLDQLQKTRLTQWKRKPEPTENEWKAEAAKLVDPRREDETEEEYDTRLETMKDQAAQAVRERKAKLPKFNRLITSPIADDPSTPEDILSYDQDGNVQGIDLLAYIGFVHAALRELADQVANLKGSVA